MTQVFSPITLNHESTRALFKKLYGESAVEDQLERYRSLIHRHEKRFGKGVVRLFSAPGRTEIGGNHTDHNAGRVLAGAVDLDAIAAVTPNQTGTISVVSEGYADPFVVRIDDLESKPIEKQTTTALIRGIAARFQELGHALAGFDATVESRVSIGSGLSSSAAFEVLIGVILNGLFNENRIAPEAIAQIGQYAENRYFNKPCGLMDQLTSALGGVVSIDFQKADQPKFERIPFDFDTKQIMVLVVHTGGSHADLTPDYASIPAEMKAVAQQYGKTTCREITLDDLLKRIPELRGKTGDRAILRAFHFLKENERVLNQVDALKRGDLTAFLTLVRESGDSSFRWLQNVYSLQNPSEQGISLALAMVEHALSGREGAWRVHGGGFAGTIQLFVSNSEVSTINRLMSDVFGEGSVTRLRIRPEGACEIPWDETCG